MGTFTKELSIRWSDLDPNYHVRHSVYYDFGAQHRIDILEQFGLTMKVMQTQWIGPILFREECVFRKEIKRDSKVFINTKIGKMKTDASRWSIVHELTNEDNELYAKITVDGAWMDLKLRKLAHPLPQIVVDVMNEMPKTDDFITQ